MMKNEERFGNALIFAFILVTLVFASLGCASATPPDEAWNETYEGGGEDAAWEVQQTSDGGSCVFG
ncbi:hypothetical protein C5S31_03525 [ANME-1 cluster archaeon GoMg2]|nr:hypothetical protein [ANME-1 cluster archaeon GoMg2]